MNPEFSVIGTRNTKSLTQQNRVELEHGLKLIVCSGYTVKSGGAPGIDQWALKTALVFGGDVHIVLPWKDFEAHFVSDLKTKYPHRVKLTIYHPITHKHWREAVDHYHPNPQSLSQGALALLSRDFAFVESVKGVAAMPSTSLKGGTRYTMGLTNALNVPCLDFSEIGALQELKNVIGLDSNPLL